MRRTRRNSVVARIVITTVGTTGDVVPYLALARALVARGHDALLVTHAMHEQLVRSKGVEFFAESDFCTVERFNAVLDEVRVTKEPLKQFELLLNKLFLRRAEPRFNRHVEASKGADFVVSNGFDFLGQEGAIQNEVPWASVTLMPHLIPTDEAPVYPLPNLGDWWIRGTWKTLYALAQDINRRTRLVLEPLGAPRRSLGVAGAIADRLHLVGASPHIGHERGDWPPQVKMTGAWLDAAPDYTPDAELAAFLEANPRPVVVTFGSMGGSEAEATSAIVMEALARTKRPAIVQSGYSGLAAEGDAILSVGYVPHHFLFAQAGCIVHHCGAGTSTAACRAGVPSVPVPHLFDQYYWAGMLHERGVAPKPIFRKDLTARRLARRIEDALKPKYVEAARALGPQVEAEDGTNRAVDAIEAALDHRDAPPTASH